MFLLSACFGIHAGASSAGDSGPAIAHAAEPSPEADSVDILPKALPPLQCESIGCAEPFYIPRCEVFKDWGPYRATWEEVSEFHQRNRVQWRPRAPEYAQGHTTPPQLAAAVALAYPAEGGSEDGQTLVKVIVDRRGRTQDAMVICSTDPRFDKPALAAVKKLVYRPAMSHEAAIVDYGNVRTWFRPQGSKLDFRARE